MEGANKSLMDARHAGDTKHTTSQRDGGNTRDKAVEAARFENEEELGRPPRSLLHQLRQNLLLLSPAERQIGEYVLAHPCQVLRLPTDQLAREIGVSQGTLSNFSQALGYSGFKAFRLDLAAEVNAPLHLNQTAIARSEKR